MMGSGVRISLAAPMAYLISSKGAFSGSAFEAPPASIDASVDSAILRQNAVRVVLGRTRNTFGMGTTDVGGG
jgi:hypothetical protein